MALRYFMGMDGGGSKTLCVIADERGRVCARAVSGCGNHQVDAALAERSINQALDLALAQAGLEKADLAASLLGLSGADREADFRVLRPMAARLGLPRVDVACDTAIALRAGTKRPYGVVSICGSGTNAYGVSPEGVAHQCGGFGYEYGDATGGGSIAVQVFRAVVRAWQGRAPETSLTPLLLRTLGDRDVEAMYNRCLDEGYFPAFSLAKLAFEAAEAGDGVALNILKHQGEELGAALCATIRALGMQRETFDAVLAGSIYSRGDADGRFVRRYVEAALQETAPSCTARVLCHEPVLGALMMAHQLVGCEPDPGALASLRDALKI